MVSFKTKNYGDQPPFSSTKTSNNILRHYITLFTIAECVLLKILRVSSLGSNRESRNRLGICTHLDSGNFSNIKKITQADELLRTRKPNMSLILIFETYLGLQMTNTEKHWKIIMCFKKYTLFNRLTNPQV